MNISFQIAQSVSRRPITQNGGANSVPGQAIWDLWYRKWQWNRIFSKHFWFSTAVSFVNAPYLSSS